MQKLVEGLHKFRSEIFDSNQNWFNSLAAGQTPEALFITCSDSRINPNLITQTGPGDLFILRNAGNLVPPYGASSSGEAATIEFALVALGVKHIVVCGHTLCGAMRGVLDPKLVENLPAMKTWLNHAEVTRQLVNENYPDVEGEARLTIAAEENVLAQIESLRTHPAVRSRLARGSLALYGWIYQIETGEVFQYEHQESQFRRIAETASAHPIPDMIAKRHAI